MSRTIAAVIVGLVTTAGALAQLPGMPRGRSNGLQGEAKLRWVTERLELDEQQQQLAEDLIALYHAELEEAKQNTVQILRRIQAKLAEIDEAKAAGDTERVRRLQAELAEMGPETGAEKRFFRSLSEVLTPEQKARIEQLRKEAAQVRATPQPRNKPTVVEPTPPGQQPAQPEAKPAAGEPLRPAAVLRAVLATELDKAQRTQLEQVLADFREEMRVRPPRGDEDRQQKVKDLIKQVKGLLKAEQQSEFDEQIDDFSAEPEAADKPEVR